MPGLLCECNDVHVRYAAELYVCLSLTDCRNRGFLRKSSVGARAWTKVRAHTRAGSTPRAVETSFSFIIEELLGSGQPNTRTLTLRIS